MGELTEGVAMPERVAEEPAVTSAVAEPTDRTEDVRACLTANHANTLALLACLRAVDADEARPYRDVEDELVDDVAMGLTMQTPHTLLALLMKAGGIERIDVPEGADGVAGETNPAGAASAVAVPAGADEGAAAGGALAANGAISDGATPEQGDVARGEVASFGAGAPVGADVATEAVATAAPAEDAPAVLDDATAEDAPGPSGPVASATGEASAPSAAAPTHADQPIDYLLRITDAGRAALIEFDPAARLADLVTGEPDGYLDAYLLVLDACQGDGASLPQLEAALKDCPALTTPKRVYPAYFVSKLETVGAIAWDGTWRLTPEGERALEGLAG